jgi:hypothetical protein
MHYKDEAPASRKGSIESQLPAPEAPPPPEFQQDRSGSGGRDATSQDLERALRERR